MHHLGDKLNVMAHAASWLTPYGWLMANFAAANCPIAGTMAAAVLWSAGFIYDTRRKRLSCEGARIVRFPFRYDE